VTRPIKLSVIVPAFNEEKTIISVLERVRATQVPSVNYEVIVVDDGSKDRTAELLKARPHLYDRLICQERNQGKGAAVQAALRTATGDYIVFQDADLEYDPADIEKMLVPVLKFDADVVMGSRFLAPSYTRVHYFFHKLGNHFITLTFNLLFNKTFTDIYTCYLLYRRDLVSADELRTKGWQQHGEILAKCVRRSKGHYEAPISYHGRTYDEGKKIRARHVFAIVATIVQERFASPTRPQPPVKG
jgi:glycosyltransferase involved in cell wall biosynthesis